jgi:hypothetical protein
MDENLRIDPTIAYDVVELPSRGIYYPNKKKSVRVAYLTAPDEDILLSPNLGRTGEVIPELLKRKVLDKDLSIDDIVDEDKEAILIFLRNTAWGTDYHFSPIDPKTDKPFECKIDLSSVKLKDFTLQEDVNGEYPYFMEKSKTNISFKFLTKKQLDEVEKLKESWNGVGIAPTISKQLEMMIKSVNGNKDMMEIHNFVNKIPISDSQKFRKYVQENKPGLDLTQKVTTPSGEEITISVSLGFEFFRPFYGL